MELNLTLARALALALSFASASAFAQSAPAGAGSTGNFPVITVPPPPMSAVSNPPTPGADSTLWSNGIPGPRNSSVTIPLPAAGGGTGGGGGPPPPPAVQCTPGTLTKDFSVPCSKPGYVGQHVKQCQVAETCPSGPYGPPSYGAPQNCVTIQQCTPPGGPTCTPGQVPLTQQASCPAGETVGGVLGGPTTFQQSETETETCPSGPTGAPSYNYSGWTPAVASACAVPGNGIGGGGCTLAQVRAGTCATCSYLCGSTESGFATCQTHNINATTCSYWGYSGSSCPAGATGGNWRAGLCP